MKQTIQNDIQEISYAERILDAYEEVNSDQTELDQLADRAEFNRNLFRLLLVGLFCLGVIIGADFIWPFDTL